MPTSAFQSISPIVEEIARLQPQRMIELGVGFGKYGVLAREALDGMYGRCQSAEWQRVICGVEIFVKYENPCWKAYNWVSIADFSKRSGEAIGWDLVLMVDSLEHLTPEVGSVCTVVSIPGRKDVHVQSV